MLLWKEYISFIYFKNCIVLLQETHSLVLGQPTNHGNANEI